MKYSKAIYAWWKGLPIWVRFPAAIVLVIALVALVFEGLVKLLFPREPEALEPVISVREGMAERSAEKLKDAVDKADKRYEDTKRRMANETNDLFGYEKAVRSADDVDAVDAFLSGFRREQRERAELDERRKRRGGGD